MPEALRCGLALTPQALLPFLDHRPRDREIQIFSTFLETNFNLTTLMGSDGRLARQEVEVLHDRVQRVVEITVVALLQVGDVDSASESP